MSTELVTLSKSDEVIQSLEKNGITQTLINELAKHKDLTVDVKVENGQVIYNAEQLKIVSEKRKLIKNTRVIVEKVFKGQRDQWTALSKENRADELKVVGVLSPVEEALELQEKKVEEAKAQVKKEQDEKDEAIFKNRVLELQELGMVSKDFGITYVLNEISVAASELKYFPEGGYKALLAEVEAEKERLAKIQAEETAAKKAEEERLAKIKEEQEAEAKRLEAIAKEQAEKQRLIDEAQARIDAEKKRIEDEKLAAEQAKIREQELEAARVEAAAKAKKEAEEKAERERIEAEEKAKAEELARIEAEKKAAEKEARRIARMPDKKKLLEFADSITAIVSPELKSEEATKILNDAVLRLSQLSQTIKSQTETL